MQILIIHGPNMPLTGKIASHSNNSRLTLDKINKSLRKTAGEMGIELKIFQCYDETQMVKIIARKRNEIQGLLINPGTLARTCYTLSELISIIQIPLVEVHLQEFPQSRDSYDHSMLINVARKRILDTGTVAYIKGLQSLSKIIRANKK